MKNFIGQDQYIAAIGASAGGLEELYRFFDNTPVDGISYVVVQHLSPDFKSKMSELLNRHSLLQVKEAEQNMPVEINTVYFIPGDKFMTISNNKLHLTERKNVPRPHLT